MDRQAALPHVAAPAKPKEDLAAAFDLEAAPIFQRIRQTNHAPVDPDEN
jgi:hypothetical protein